MPKKLLFILRAISRYGLAAMFLFAVVAKLWYITSPTESFVKNMPYLVGARWAWPVAIAVISLELLTVVLLLLPRTVRWGGVLAGILLMGFAGYALYYRYGLGNLEGLECGCFGGIIASQLGVSTALRNLLLMIPVGLVVFGSKREARLESAGEPDAAVAG